MEVPDEDQRPLDLGHVRRALAAAYPGADVRFSLYPTGAVTSSDHWVTRPDQCKQTDAGRAGGPQWPLDLVPEDDSEHAAVWRELSPEAQAVLALLYASPGWQLVNRSGDAAIERGLHQLDMELLIFRNRAGEARITARGVELIEEYAALEVAS